ncbi:MAG: hypothetical protein M3Q27_11650 [Actinomycetota bacterium]|nr:hypothetical protein [Actinomycetota bacterium]
MPRSLMLRSLSTCQPGPAVMCQLAGLDPAGLTGEERIDYVIAWERCEAWVAAGKQRALAVMGTAPGDPDPLDVHLGLAPIQGSSADLVSRADAQDERGVHSEVAFALRLGPAATATRLATARRLAGPSPTLPATFTALATGAIRFLHALAIAETLRPLEGDQPATTEAEARALRVATSDTVGRTRTVAAKAVVALDPSGADDRHRERAASAGCGRDRSRTAWRCSP